MDIHTFVGKAIDELMYNGVSVEFTKRKRFGKYGYNFFYDGSIPKIGKTPKLKINFYSNYFRDSFPIFVHEYCHFLQWKEQTPIWCDSESASVNFDNWLLGKYEDFGKDQLTKIQLMELDCDVRAVKLIKEYELPIDITQYTKESNSYILSYDICHEFRDFRITYHYTNSELLDMLPSRHITKKDIINGIDGYRDKYLKLINN